jgi:hypothetical protein
LAVILNRLRPSRRKHPLFHRILVVPAGGDLGGPPLLLKSFVHESKQRYTRIHGLSMDTCGRLRALPKKWKIERMAPVFQIVSPTGRQGNPIYWVKGQFVVMALSWLYGAPAQ